MRKILLTLAAIVCSATLALAQTNYISKVHMQINFPTAGHFWNSDSIVFSDYQDPSDVPYEISSITLIDWETRYNVSGAALEAGKSYFLDIALWMSEDGYEFRDDVDIKVNGEVVEKDPDNCWAKYQEFFVFFSVNEDYIISVVGLEVIFPEAGQHPNTLSMNIENNANYDITSSEVHLASTGVVPTENLAPNTEYYISASIYVIDPYTFADDVKILANGVEATILPGGWNECQFFKIPFTTGAATALDETATDASAVKRLVNGQLLIEKNGRTFNALGAEVK